ncbi:MAG: aminotransferase class V-fold PLP-dependent enzyme [Magnetococcales bacterium]|nr:aminotransferase class V-fold PLP-dependent enzyme [Magnetococcales bacterium]
MPAFTSSSFRAEFPHEKGLIYLNHAGVGPIPTRSANRMKALADTMATVGAFRYPETFGSQWDEARHRTARLINADMESVAFIPNTSSGLSYIAIGMDWKKGDSIVTTDQEFPSNSLIWQDQISRHGAKVHRVPSGLNGRVSAEKLLERVDQSTRIIAVSSIQFGSGAGIDLEILSEALQDTDTLLVVDAIQSLGVLPMDVKRLKVDAVVADGHKWLLGPEGCGLFYLSDKARAQIQSRVLGWHSLANAGEYNRTCYDIRDDMKRFEPGTPNVIGAVAMGESINLLLEVGLASIRDRVRGMTGYLAEALLKMGCTIHTPMEQDGKPSAGIVVFSHPDYDMNVLSSLLMKQGIYHAKRGPGLRLSPHFYLNGADIEQAITDIQKALSR